MYTPVCAAALLLSDTASRKKHSKKITHNFRPEISCNDSLFSLSFINMYFQYHTVRSINERILLILTWN